jgi:NAD(P)-dependent dehydrogenase (short-subunit alcohol dehydrogenase family)
MFTLQGKTALLTGATGHLGRAMALALAQAGARVLANGRDAAKVQALVDSLRAEGLAAEALVFDVANKEAIDAALRPFASEPIHVLVNNAYAGGAGTIEHSEAAQYGGSYGITVVAAHNLLRAALPSLRLAARDGGASVINIASMYAVVSPDPRLYDDPAGANPPFYGAAKAALLQWTRYAACEFGPQGIRVNSISPGPFPNQAVQETNPAFIGRLASRVPLGRIGRADEIAGPVLFLASPASSFVNGANIAVDGGWTAW